MFSCSLVGDPWSRCCFAGHLDFARCHCDHCFLPLWPSRTMEAFTFLSSASELLDSEQQSVTSAKTIFKYGFEDPHGMMPQHYWSVTSAKTIFRLRMVLKIHSRVWVECKSNKNICLKNYWEMIPLRLKHWALSTAIWSFRQESQHAKRNHPHESSSVIFNMALQNFSLCMWKKVKFCKFATRFCQCEQNWLYLNPVEGYMDINLLIWRNKYFILVVG